MTEQEWPASDDPARMLRLFRNVYRDRDTGKPVIGDRKLWLFACACARQVWDLLVDDAPCSKCGGCHVLDLLLGRD